LCALNRRSTVADREHTADEASHRGSVQRIRDNEAFDPTPLRGSVVPLARLVGEPNERVGILSRESRARAGDPELELRVSIQVEPICERAAILGDRVLESPVADCLLEFRDVRRDGRRVEAKVSATQKNSLDAECLSNMID
jgi:hypothetical protein